MLTRENVTTASRLMLPTYVFTFAALGLSYALGPRETLVSPPLAFADQMMPLRAWGCVFLACSAAMASALLLRRRMLFRFALRMCGVSMFVWAGVITLATLAGDASLSAPVWSAFIGIACFASDRSLAIGEK